MQRDFDFPVIYWGEAKSTQVQFYASDELPLSDVKTSMCAVIQDGALLMVQPPRGWGLPGGHIEQGETPQQCAIRECQEEANVTIGNLRLIGYWQTKKLKQLPSNIQYPSVGYQALYLADVLQVHAFTPKHESLAREFVPLNQVANYHPTFDTFKEILRYIIQQHSNG